MRVYKGLYNSYYTVFKSNAMNLRYDMQVQFKKGYEPSTDIADVKLLNWFGSCYKKRNGEIAPKIVVMEYELEKHEDDSNTQKHDCNGSGNSPVAHEENKSSATPNQEGEFDPFSDTPKDFY